MTSPTYLLTPLAIEELKQLLSLSGYSINSLDLPSKLKKVCLVSDRTIKNTIALLKESKPKTGVSLKSLNTFFTPFFEQARLNKKLTKHHENIFYYLGEEDCHSTYFISNEKGSSDMSKAKSNEDVANLLNQLDYIIQQNDFSARIRDRQSDVIIIGLSESDEFVRNWLFTRLQRQLFSSIFPSISSNDVKVVDLLSIDSLYDLNTVNQEIRKALDWAEYFPDCDVIDKIARNKFVVLIKLPELTDDRSIKTIESLYDSFFSRVNTYTIATQRRAVIILCFFSDPRKMPYLGKYKIPFLSPIKVNKRDVNQWATNPIVASKVDSRRVQTEMLSWNCWDEKDRQKKHKDILTYLGRSVRIDFELRDIMINLTTIE